MTDWNTLLALQAGAAATLVGLVFVAVSINLDRVLAYPGLPDRAAETILQFLEVFLISTVALVPGQRELFLAIELLVIGVIFWVIPIVLQIRYLRLKTGHPRWWFALRSVQSQLATIPFCVAGIALLMGAPGALYSLVPGFVFSFVSGVVNSWILLVEIRR
jgi:hypothetical protein